MQNIESTTPVEFAFHSKDLKLVLEGTDIANFITKWRMK